MRYKLFETDEFCEWKLEQTARSLVQIADRLEKIKDVGYFGDRKLVRENIWELR